MLIIFIVQQSLGCSHGNHYHGSIGMQPWQSLSLQHWDASMAMGVAMAMEKNLGLASEMGE